MSGPSLRAIVYYGRRGPGDSARWTGACRPLAPPAVWQYIGVRDWPGLSRPRPRPRPRPGSRRVYPTGWGVQREGSSSSQCCCCVPRPPGESGGRGERVRIGLHGNCCVSPCRWPALWAAPSSGACFHGDYTLPAGLPTHLGQCVWSRTRARVSLDRAGAEGPGGQRALGSLDAAFRPGPLGQPGVSAEEEGRAPASSRRRRHSLNRGI